MTQSIEKAGSELVLFAPHLKVAMQMVQPLIPCFVGLQLRAICGQLHNMRRCGVSHSPPNRGNGADLDIHTSDGSQEFSTSLDETSRPKTASIMHRGACSATEACKHKSSLVAGCLGQRLRLKTNEAPHAISDLCTRTSQLAHCACTALYHGLHVRCSQPQLVADRPGCPNPPACQPSACQACSHRSNTVDRFCQHFGHEEHCLPNSHNAEPAVTIPACTSSRLCL